MDRFEVALKGQMFAVIDKTDDQEVFVGGKTEVEDFLDFQENMIRINAEKVNKGQGFQFLKILFCWINF